MYTSPVPLMVIHTDTDSLIEVNGHLLGECGSNSYVAMPVSDTGDYYVCITPLSQGRYTIMRKLHFEGGNLADAIMPDVSVCIWPGGVYDFFLQTGNAPLEASELSETQCEALYGEYRLSLCVADELQLYAERDGRPYCRYLLGDYESGEFKPYEDLMGLLLNGALGARLLLFDADLQTLLDLKGSAVFLEDAPVCIERLPTLLGHEKRTRYSRIGAHFQAQRPSIGFFTSKRPYPQDGRSLAVAFFEAVREGFNDEALSYLSPELKAAFSFSEIASFIGPFSEVRTPLSNSSGHVIGLSSGGSSQIQTMRLYRLSFENGLISNISEDE